MKKILLLPFLLFSIASNAVKITIIESQSYGHTMDQKWLTLANSLGDTAAIYPQTTLDNNTFFATTDVLIVSSGVIPLPANRVATILQYLQQGGKVYLQSEYLMTFDTDIAFAYLVNTLGGSFSWLADVSGTLAPMVILGSMATTNTTVTPLTYFWYGVAGQGCSNVEPFLEYQGQYFGFIFCPPSASVGKLITTTDQDWLQSGGTNEANLMANILTNLLNTSFNCTSGGYQHLNLGPDTTICAGDSIILNAKSGFTSYQWQNGSIDSVFTVNSTGTYWVQVTNPCGTYRDTIIITTQSCGSLPVALFASSDTVFCDEAGKCISFFDFSTGNPTSWKWLFPGASPDSSLLQNPDSICYYYPGTYPVTLIVTNTSGTDTLTVSPMITLANPPAVPTLTLSHDTIFSSHATAYQWYYNGNIIAGATDSFYVYSSAGTYSVQISDGNGCNVLSGGMIITGLSPLSFGEGIGVRPNPATNEFAVYGLQFSNEATLELYNVVGEKVYSRQLAGSGAGHQTSYSVSTDGLANGIYLVHIRLSEGADYFAKIAVMKK